METSRSSIILETMNKDIEVIVTVNQKKIDSDGILQFKIQVNYEASKTQS